MEFFITKIKAETRYLTKMTKRENKKGNELIKTGEYIRYLLQTVIKSPLQ